MKICFIAEGSYPYITGGVSSWVYNFFKWFPEYDFKIIAIAPNEEKQGVFAYKLAENISEISEMFLGTALKKINSNAKGKFFKDEQEKVVIERHLSGEFSNWQEIFDIVRSWGQDRACGFFSSSDYLDIAKRIYMKKYNDVPFGEFIWLLRSMYLYQFYVLSADIQEADAYHSVSCGYAGLIGALASYVYNKPLVVTEHGIYTREREEEIIKNDNIKDYAREIWIKYFYNMSLAAYRFARTVISLYERNRQIQIDFGCPESKTMIIPNAIDLSHFEAKTKSEGSITQEEREILVGAVVRVVPIKDIITMLKGYSIAKAQDKRLKLLVVGPYDEDEEYYNYCLEYVEKNNIHDVVFTGKVDVRKYLRKIDMLLLSSISEAQPLAIMEGMACNVPVIATNVGSCSELIYGVDDNFGDAGIVIPIMDSEKLSENILYLAKNPEVAKKMGAVGALRIRSFYSKERFIENYKIIYAILKGGKNGGNWFPVERTY